VAAIFVPLVVLYQSWTYHVFRARVGGQKVSGPVEALSSKQPSAD
jgi:cytochrome d ubiquinol oxidase subunit II